MRTDGTLVIVGTVTVLLGVFANQISPRLAERRRLILWVGFAVLVVGIALGMPDLVQGARDGYRNAKN